MRVGAGARGVHGGVAGTKARVLAHGWRLTQHGQADAVGPGRHGRRRGPAEEGEQEGAQKFCGVGGGVGVVGGMTTSPWSPVPRTVGHPARGAPGLFRAHDTELTHAGTRCVGTREPQSLRKRKPQSPAVAGPTTARRTRDHGGRQLSGIAAVAVGVQEHHGVIGMWSTGDEGVRVGAQRFKSKGMDSRHCRALVAGNSAVGEGTRRQVAA